MTKDTGYRVLRSVVNSYILHIAKETLIFLNKEPRTAKTESLKTVVTVYFDMILQYICEKNYCDKTVDEYNEEEIGFIFEETARKFSKFVMGIFSSNCYDLENHLTEQFMHLTNLFTKKLYKHYRKELYALSPATEIS